MFNRNNRFEMNRTHIALRKGVDSLCGAIRSCRREPLKGDVYESFNCNRTIQETSALGTRRLSLYYNRPAWLQGVDALNTSTW